MQYYSAVLIPLSAMSALDVPKYTKSSFTHTHTLTSFPKGHKAHCAISGAALPSPCSFIAAVEPGGVG